MTFKLRSGNKTPFKMMGSSPIRDHEMDASGNIVQHEQDTRTEETKKLDATLDQIDRARLYDATQKDKLTAETTGVRGKETIKTAVAIKKNRKSRGETENAYPSYGNTGIPITTVSSSNPDYVDKKTKKAVSTDTVSNKNRTSEYEKNKNIGIFGDHEERTYTPGDKWSADTHGDVTHSRSSVFDAESNTRTTTSTTTAGYVAPKVDMPIISLDPIKAELPIVTPKPHEPKKARMPSTGKKAKKAKRVKRPKGKKTRNLVTGGKNKTFRSTGTSKRKNRVIAGLTFWNSKD